MTNFNKRLSKGSVVGSKLLTAMRCAVLCAMPILGVEHASADTPLRITLQTPLTSSLGQNLVVFKEALEETSDFDVQIFDSAQLFRDKEVPEAVSMGVIDMGVVALTRYASAIPAVDVFYMPFAITGDDAVREAIAPGSGIRAPLDAAVLETGARVLWWQTNGPVVLLSDDGPIAHPDDMVNKKVRVFGKTVGNWVKEIGGAPTLISGSEQFLAYQRGTVDVGMTGLGSVGSRSLWEVKDTLTLTNHAHTILPVIINEDFWQGLTAEERAQLQSAALVAEEAMLQAAAADAASIVEVAKSNGMAVHSLNDAEVSAWRERSQPVYEAWLESAGELGATVLKAAQ